jgi:hypothetical protein
MKRPTREEELAIVRQWIQAAPALAAQRHKELRERSYDWTTVDALLDMGSRFGRPRFAEGMVEMQRLFHRAASQSKPV